MNRTKFWVGAAAWGLSLSFGAGANNAVQPTYAKDIAPILNNNCVTCHRPGEIGPMSLLSYDEVRPWAKSIKQYVSERQMPPWHADPGYGPWKDERKLSEDQIATIVNWVDAGAPKGNLADAPPVPHFEEGGWVLGEPDYIIEFPKVDVPADSSDDFHNLVHQTNFDDDKWITGVEIKPGNRKVVHHVILWQGSQGNQDGWIDAWAAGNQAKMFPDGTGRLLKKGASIIGDMHYHPAEADASDVTQVGIHFAEKEVAKQLVNLWIANATFEIPAGDPNHKVESSFTFPQDSHVLSLTPHMHYRGKDFHYTATFPDGTKKELLKVSKYDFNWQTTYFFEEPLAAPKGTRIDCVAHFDNSADNPDNPDPTRNVTFGNESYDEMMIGFADYIVDEGVRPSYAPDAAMTLKVQELAKQFPGEIWTVNIGNPGQPQLSAVHVPKTGEGGWYVNFNGNVLKARIYEIAWTDNAFTASFAIPGQAAQKLKGSVDAAAKTIVFDLTEEDGDTESVWGNLAE